MPVVVKFAWRGTAHIPGAMIATRLPATPVVLIAQVLNIVQNPHHPPKRNVVVTKAAKI